MADPNFSGPPPPGGASSDGNPYKLAPGQAGGLPPPEVLAALPHDNAAMRLNTAIWVLNAVSFVFLALRVYCKSIRSRKLWWDDWILIMAWVRRRSPSTAHHPLGNSPLTAARTRSSWSLSRRSSRTSPHSVMAFTRGTSPSRTLAGSCWASPSRAL